MSALYTQSSGYVYSPNGNSIAYIARYDMAGGSGGSGNDTIPADTGSMSITTVGDDGAIMVYPNPAAQQVTVRVQNPAFNIQHCYLTDMLGRREEVRLTATGNGQYTLDLGSHREGTYLVTVTDGDGRQHTVRILKRSDGLGD